jgi:hypothetical protein
VPLELVGNRPAGDGIPPCNGICAIYIFIVLYVDLIR